MKKHRLLLVTLLTLFSSSIAFAQITNPAPYCDASFDDQGGFDVPDQINKVSFGGLLNASDTQSPGGHYIYYNNLPTASFTKNSSYNLSVEFDVHGSAGYGVWIDFNQDGQFTNDELVSGSSGQNFLNITPNTTIQSNVTIPPDAVTGVTRMRVRIVEDDNYTMTHGAAILPCNQDSTSTGIMDWGETEDYNIRILADSTSGISDWNKESSAFSAYPDPAIATLNINMKKVKTASYKIVSISGMTLLSGNISSSHTGIDISSLSAGMYFIQLFNNGGVLGHAKFIKSDQ